MGFVFRVLIAEAKKDLWCMIKKIVEEYKKRYVIANVIKSKYTYGGEVADWNWAVAL